MDPRIADYIRANRRRYTREAITKQLLEAGHDRGEVERTWAALDTRDPDAVAGEGFWGRFALILIGINLAVFLGVALLTGMLASLFAGGVLLPVIFAIALAIGALAAWGIVAVTGPAKMSPTTAIIIGAVVPLLFALLIGGTCYALVGTVGLPPPPALQGSAQVSLGEPANIEGSLPATCQPNANPEDGFGMFINAPVGSGRTLDLSINSYPPGPGGPLRTTVWVSVWPEVESEATPPMQWSNEMGGGQGVELSGSATSGTLRLDGLPSGIEVPGSQPLPLSGEISWTCE